MCREDELRDGIVRTARLGLDDDGLPVLALLLRDESGDIVAYRNLPVSMTTTNRARMGANTTAQ